MINYLNIDLAYIVSVPNSVGLMLLWVWCHGATIPLWVQNFLSRVFCGSEIFLVCILWVQNFLSWEFRGSKIFLVDVSYRHESHHQ